MKAKTIRPAACLRKVKGHHPALVYKLSNSGKRARRARRATAKLFGF